MASSLTNVAQWVQAGAALAQYTQSTSGLPYGSAPSNGSSVGMTTLAGFRVANLNIPQADILQVQGDDGVRAVLQFPGNALPTFDMEFADVDMDFIDVLQGTTKIDAQSVYDVGYIDPKDRSFPDIFLVLTSRAFSTEAGNTGNGYRNLIFPQCTISFNNPGGFQTGANDSPATFTVTVNRTSQTPWGTALSTGTHGTTGAAGFLVFSEEPITFDVFAQDGADADIAPTIGIASNNQVIAWNDIAGTTATLSVTYGSPTASQFNFTAQSAGELTLFMYERA